MRADSHYTHLPHRTIGKEMRFGFAYMTAFGLRFLRAHGRNVISEFTAIIAAYASSLLGARPEGAARAVEPFAAAHTCGLQSALG